MRSLLRGLMSITLAATIGCFAPQSSIIILCRHTVPLKSKRLNSHVHARRSFQSRNGIRLFAIESRPPAAALRQRAGLVFAALPQKPAPHLVVNLAFSSEGKRNDLRIIHLFWHRGAAALLVFAVAFCGCMTITLTATKAEVQVFLVVSKYSP